MKTITGKEQEKILDCFKPGKCIFSVLVPNFKKSQKHKLNKRPYNTK